MFQGKQTACPGTRLCLLQLLSLDSPELTRAQTKSCVQIISFMPDCRDTLPYLEGSVQQEPVSRPDCCMSCGSPLQLYVEAWVVTLHFWSLSSSHCHCFKHCNLSDGAVVGLALLCLCLGLRPPPPQFLSWLRRTLTHAVYVKRTHACRAACAARGPVQFPG